MKWTFTLTIVYGRYADFAAIRFLNFADAASVRICGDRFHVTRFKPPNRSLVKGRDAHLFQCRVIQAMIGSRLALVVL